MCLLAGDGGLGKSTMTAWLASRVSKGRLSGACAGEPAGVVVYSAEDTADTWKARLLAARAELGAVHFVRIDVEGSSDGVKLPLDVELLRGKVREARAKLVILDPLGALFEAGIDAHKDADVRRALEPLARLAEEEDCAVCVIAHLNKGTGHRVTYHAISGAGGIGAAARLVLMFMRDPDDPDGDAGGMRVLAVAKSNLGQFPPSLGVQVGPVEIDGDEGPMEIGACSITGETTRSARELMAEAVVEDPDERADAETWLRWFLRDGPKASQEVKDAARLRSIGERTLKTARARLDVRTVRQGFPSSTHWYLPPVEGSSQDSQDSQARMGTTVPTVLTGHQVCLRCATAFDHQGVGDTLGRVYCSAVCRDAQLDAEDAAAAPADEPEPVEAP
jgi:hypothetical protein